MTPLKHSKSLAARMGRWSANHWKTAVFGWLAFVVGSVFLGIQLGTTFIDERDANVGESRTADQMIDRALFNADENGKSIEELGEMVLLQSKTLTVTDPAFRAAIDDAIKTVRSFPEVQNVESPLESSHSGLVSEDGHSAMVQFTPKGTYEEAILYIDSIVAAVDQVESRHPGFTIDSLGVSSDKAIDAEIQGGLAKAGLISIPLTIIILMFVLGSLVAALIPLLLGITAVAATTGLLALSSKGVPASESIMEVVLLIGLAVGVDYALFYMRRERQERAAGRSESAALEAAAATSGRAVLVSGMTVLIAMAGMFLSGDKSFMSFSVGTMIVVAVAMLGSLTVLPALLSKLGDRVEKGRIPFLGRRRKRTESRFWGAILDRVLRRPLVSALAAGAVLVALALPALQLHTSQTGIEGFSSPSVEPFVRLAAAFPGTPDPAVLAIEADDVTTPEVRNAVAELERKALASGEMNPPIEIETNRGGTVTRIEIPLVGNGTDDESNAALATLRNDLLPGTLGQLDGVEYAVTGQTANSQDFNESQTSSAPKVFGFVLLFAFATVARLVPVDRDRSQGDPPEPALGRGRLRRARRDLPVGLGREPARLPVERRDRELAPDVHVRDPVRALDGLPRVHPEPDPGGLRSWALHRRRDLARDQVDGRRGHERGSRDGRGLPRLHDAPARRPQGDGHRPRGRRPDRRDARSRRAPARDDEAARKRQLVPPALARVAAEARARALGRARRPCRGQARSRAGLTDVRINPQEAPPVARSRRAAPPTPSGGSDGHHAHPSSSCRPRSSSRRVAAQ